jgi:hypothetical protein
MEDLIKNDSTFELYHNSEGSSLLNNRVLLDYPSEKSSFQVFLGFEGEKDAEKDAEKEPKKEIKVDTEKIAEGITATAGAFGSVASTVQAFKGDGTKKPTRRKLLKEVCGRKPLNKKKRAVYDTCVANYNAGTRSGNVNTETDSTPPPPPPSDDSNNNKKKIIIGLVVVGVVVGTYFAYKKGLFGAKATK